MDQKLCSDELPDSNDQHEAVRETHVETVAVDTSRQQKSDTNESRFFDYRKKWFQACNPPLVQVPDHKHEDPVQENKGSAEELPRHTNIGAAAAAPPPVSCCLTEVGQRQVCHLKSGMITRSIESS